jgi:L-malate glycosyltransferase
MTKKIKVLHCIETMGSGGVEQLKLSVSKYFDRGQFEQTIICSQVKNNYDKRFLAYGIESHPIGELRHPFNLGYYLRLIKLVRKIKPDIIHGAVFEGVISAVVAGLICRIPIIIIEETSEPLNRTWRGNWLLRFLSFFADAVLAISPSVKKYLIDVARINRKKVILRNYAVDAPNTPALDETMKIKQSLGIKPGDFVIGSVGRLRDFHKRFSVLIKAMHLIKPKYPEIKLMIVGDGEDRDNLRSLASALQVEDRVIFTGYQPNTPLFYSCMNVFALVSHMEAFGLVVVEAMYMKLPVIGTSVGGIKDIVIPGETGFLIKPHDVQATADAIEKMYCMKGQLEQFGEAGYERADRFYSAQGFAHEIQSLYLSLHNARAKG